MKQPKEKQNNLGCQETIEAEKGLDKEIGMKIYDPACGSGEFLIKALEVLNNNDHSK